MTEEPIKKAIEEIEAINATRSIIKATGAVAINIMGKIIIIIGFLAHNISLSFGLNLNIGTAKFNIFI